MISILPVIPHMDDATSFYRAMGPLSELARRELIRLCMVQEVKWSTAALADVMFLQRPFRALDIIAANRQVAWKRPLWVDFDDDLFAIPQHNKASGLYGHPDTQKCVAELVALADLVTVSTQKLGDRYNDIRNRIGKPECVVVPNALHDDFAAARPKHPDKVHKLVMWRGSDTHESDLLSVTKEIAETFGKRQDWRMHFLGYNPLWLQRCIRPNQVVSGAGIDIMDYHNLLLQICPSIMIVPLENTEFNLAKSNIAWIEATYAGAMVIAPDMPEWRMPGILNYKDEDHFGELLNYAMDVYDKERFDMVESSWNHIKEHLLLSKVNQVRMDVLHQLITKESFRAKSYLSYLAGDEPAVGFVPGQSI